MTAKPTNSPASKSSTLSHGLVIVALVALTIGLIVAAWLPIEVMQNSAERISKVKVSDNHFSDEFDHGEALRITDDELEGKNPTLLNVPSLDSFHAGRRCMQSGRFKEAITYLTKSIKQYEGEKHSTMDYQHFEMNAARYEFRSYCYVQLKDYHAALRDISRAIDIHPNIAGGDLRHRARIYELLGEKKLALEDLKRARTVPGSD